MRWSRSGAETKAEGGFRNRKGNTCYTARHCTYCMMAYSIGYSKDGYSLQCCPILSEI